MQASESVLLKRLQTFSRYILLFGLGVSLPLGYLFPDEFGWQVALAVSALVIGIPHGAVDHLITVPKMASARMALFLTGYLAVTGAAIWFFLNFQLLGFAIIVVISALHFGVGDASFLSELDKRIGGSGFPKILYALAAGFTPVMIPLVNSQSQAALEIVNPNLVGWASGLEQPLLIGFVLLNLVATAAMVIKRRPGIALDLLILLSISLLAPPLVAFAFYFGLWHALRHTGRLTLELESAKTQHQQSNPMGAFWKAVFAGIPALVLVLAFTAVLGFTTGFDLGSEILWYLLVVIWALTIPHMALTARLDARAMTQHNSIPS
jgi:Brp/Blh family beta-carotene 15,15'-monooxygenase